MTDRTDKPGTVIPHHMAELEWVWVLSAPMSQNRDSIFVIDMEETENGERRRVVPIFEAREAAAKLKPRLCGAPKPEYNAQAMRFSDVGAFAARNDLEIMMLDESGTILAHMEVKMERHSLH